jgi:flagellar hook protein FlgE
VGVAATETDFSSGPVTATTNENDVALNGNGFFAIDNAGTMELTRSGNFTVSNSGQMLTAGGAQVMGYPATNGVVNSNATLSPITLPIGQIEEPQATSTLSLTANLAAGSAPGTVVPATLQVYDSLGQAHTLTVNMTNAGTNKWTYAISLPAGDSTASTNTTGTLTFSSTGELTSPTPNLPAFTFTGLTDGANNLSMTLSTGSSTASLITQVAGTSSNVSGSTQNGYASGQYNGFTTSSNGIISATYTNGVSQQIAQLAIGSVANEQGLMQVGGNAYLSTLTSGTAAYGVAGTGANGVIEGSSLEGSNVDISEEFSDLIVAQRAFEANSKSITTFDTITNEVINMIH